MMVGLDSRSAFRGSERAGEPTRGETHAAHGPRLREANVSDKVVRIIMSYTDFVNRRVWGQSK